MKNGDKVKFTGTAWSVDNFWFTDMSANARGLNKDEIYTISNIEIMSSCTYVKLQETDELIYNAAWFTKYEK